MKNFQIISIGMIVIIIALLGYSAYTDKIRYDAVDNCIKSASYTWKSSNEQKTTPDFTWFETCLKRKGIN